MISKCLAARARERKPMATHSTPAPKLSREVIETEISFRGCGILGLLGLRGAPRTSQTGLQLGELRDWSLAYCDR